MPQRRTVPSRPGLFRPFLFGRRRFRPPMLEGGDPRKRGDGRDKSGRDGIGRRIQAGEDGELPMSGSILSSAALDERRRRFCFAHGGVACARWTSSWASSPTRAAHDDRGRSRRVRAADGGARSRGAVWMTASRDPAERRHGAVRARLGAPREAVRRANEAK